MSALIEQSDAPVSGAGANATAPSVWRDWEPGKIIAVVAAVLSVALATGIVLRHVFKKDLEGMDRIMHWRCLNESCQQEFSMTIAEFRATIERGPPGGELPQLSLAELNAQSLCGLSPDQPLWCPHCGQYNIGRGHPCPHCDGIVRLGAHGQMPDVCPTCGLNPGLPRTRDDPGSGGRSGAGS